MDSRSEYYFDENLRDIPKDPEGLHVLQWKKDFKGSGEFFKEVLQICRSNGDAEEYLDFALQYAGKNLFDQNKYSEALILFEETLIIRQHKKSPQDQIDSTLLAIQVTKTRLSFPSST